MDRPRQIHFWRLHRAISHLKNDRLILTAKLKPRVALLVEGRMNHGPRRSCLLFVLHLWSASVAEDGPDERTWHRLVGILHPEVIHPAAAIAS